MKTYSCLGASNVDLPLISSVGSTATRPKTTATTTTTTATTTVSGRRKEVNEQEKRSGSDIYAHLK